MSSRSWAKVAMFLSASALTMKLNSADRGPGVQGEMGCADGSKIKSVSYRSKV